MTTKPKIIHLNYSFNWSYTWLTVNTIKWQISYPLYFLHIFLFSISCIHSQRIYIEDCVANCKISGMSYFSLFLVSDGCVLCLVVNGKQTHYVCICTSREQKIIFVKYYESGNTCGFDGKQDHTTRPLCVILSTLLE